MCSKVEQRTAIKLCIKATGTNEMLSREFGYQTLTRCNVWKFLNILRRSILLILKKVLTFYAPIIFDVFTSLNFFDALNLFLNSRMIFILSHKKYEIFKQKLKFRIFTYLHVFKKKKKYRGSVSPPALANSCFRKLVRLFNEYYLS